MIRVGRYFVVNITAADTSAFLTGLIQKGVEVLEPEYIDDLTVRVKINQQNFETVNVFAAACGVKCELISGTGLLWTFFSLRKRPVLIVGMTLFILIALYLPTRVLFVTVEGNVTIPEKLILEQASKCGIGIGSSRRAVRSERVKNALLAENPMLQWVGVNTSGCVAQISVKERSMIDEDAKRLPMISSIVASRDGVISQIIALEGTALCVPGQQVHAGDVLISGYTDCGRVIQAENAKGEVFAHTLRKQTLIAPKASIQKGDEIDRHTCYSLKIGKKVINFCNHSGIQWTTCDKMYLEKFWTLPGGFQLPISVIQRICISRETVQEAVYDQRDLTWLEGYALEYLSGQMIAGKIHSWKHDLQMEESICTLTGSYVCNEMIGQVKYEETWEENA